MGKLLDALANDSLCVDTDVRKRNPDYQKVYDEMAKAQDELERILGEKEKEMFDRFVNLQAEESACYAKERFIMGFCLGCRMVTEVYLEPNSLCQEMDTGH